MANINAKIPLDNYVQNGDTTLEQILNDVAAVNNGEKPGVAEQIRDQSNGKLIRVELVLPDSVASQAINAINANPGVPTTVHGCVPQLLATDLNASNPNGIVWGGAANWGYSAAIQAWDNATDWNPINQGLFVEALTSTGSILTRLGRLNGTPNPATNTYLDENKLVSAAPIRIRVLAQTAGALDGVNNPNVPAGEVLWEWKKTEVLTLNFSNGQSLALQPNNNFSLITTGSSLGATAQLFIYVASDGKMYVALFSGASEGVSFKLGTQVFGDIPLRTYDEACAHAHI